MRLRNIPRAEGDNTEPSGQQSSVRKIRRMLEAGVWNENPIYIEIGMGKGRFLLNMAKQYPNVNFIGIERYSSVLLRALEKYDTEEFQELTNIRFVLHGCKRTSEVFAKGEVERIYLNFSDPWPKARHAKRRLTSTEFFCPL